MSININDAELGKFMELAGEVGVKVFLLHGDNWREAVATSGSLPWSGNTLGDIRQATDTGTLYRWNGASWDMYDNIANVLTTPTSTDTSVASQGGLLINIDGATGDTAVTANGWIENEKFGAWLQVSANAASAEFDTAIIPGEKVLKLSATDVTGNALVHLGYNGNLTATALIESLYKYAFPVKASTKYVLRYPIKTLTVGTNGAYSYISIFQTNGTRNQLLPSTKFSGTNDWTWVTHEFTTGATDAFMTIALRNEIAGQVSDTYFRLKQMTLEEIVEPVSNSLTSPSWSIIWFQGQGSMDNIDQALDTTAAFANTYTPPVAISEVATELQTFVPTKVKLSRIGIYIASKGTGNWTLTVHDSGNVVQGAQTIVNASLTNNAWNYFMVPQNLIIWGTYHFHVTSTVADGTMKVNTASDLETCSFIENYYKPSTSFTARQNNVLLDIRSDADGFVEWGTYNIEKWFFRLIDSVNDGSVVNTSYFDKHIGTTFSGNVVQFAWANRYYIQKINTAFPVIGDLYYNIAFITNNTISYSFDNKVYYTLGTLVSGGTTYRIPMNGNSIVYIKNNANAAGSMTAYGVYAEIDTSKVKSLYNYPTNKDIIQTYTKQVNTNVTTATYRVNKFGFPAIEYSNGEYQFLDIDTTASGSTVAFSANGSSYTTVADGASIALTSTLIPIVWVKVNITANRIYISSNDSNIDSTKDGSMKFGVIYQVKNQGLSYDVQDLQREVNELKVPDVPWMIITTGDIVDEAWSYLIIPTVTGNINLFKIPKAGKRFSVIVRTSGTTSYTLTFNTGFKSTGTLATGTVDAKYFTVNFISDGIQAIETSRTTAM